MLREMAQIQHVILCLIQQCQPLAHIHLLLRLVAESGSHQYHIRA